MTVNVFFQLQLRFFFQNVRFSIRSSVLFYLFLSLGSQSIFSQPPCSSNPAANDYCSGATPICNLNGYCGNTSSSYTPYVSSLNHSNETNTPLGNVFCAGIQNNSWLKFIADSTSAVFNIWVSNCQQDYGIQMQIYSTSDCYTYVPKSNCWNPGYQTNGQIVASNLVPGQVYYFMIDGSHGDVCDYVISATQGVNTTPTTTASQQICYGEAANITATGGSTYQWTSSPSDLTLSGQTSSSSILVSPQETTTYTVTVTKSGANTFCDNNVTVLSTMVIVNPLPEFSLSNTNDHCGLHDGTATVHITDSSGQYTYNWLLTPAQYTVTATGLTTGTDTVVVSNQYGCTGTESVLIGLDTFLAPVIAAPEVLCADSFVVLDVGSQYSSYLWSNSASTNSITITTGGLYSVQVWFSTCTGKDTVFLTVDTIPVPVIDGPEYICYGESDTLSIAGIYAFQLWSEEKTDTMIQITHGGAYWVVVSDSFGCRESSEIYILQRYGPNFTLTSTNEFCDRSDGTATADAQNGTGTIHYNWSTSDTIPSITGLTAGFYYIMVTDSFCPSYASVEIHETPGPIADFRVTPAIPEFNGSKTEVDFIDLSQGSVFSWQWDFGDGTYPEFIQNPTHYYDSSLIYSVELIVTDVNNCFDTIVKSLNIVDQFNMYVPNAFTPDGDGVNDLFFVQSFGVDVSGFSMWIFDRWGFEIFHTTSWLGTMSEGWNGTLQNSGETIIPGVYAYRIIVKDQKNIIHELFGHIVLIN